MKKEKTLFEQLYESGEEHFARFTRELFSHPSFSAAVEKALRNAAKTKGTVDRNINAFLGLFNIPSKADYSKLLAKVETLQGSLVNLNIKLDRVLAAKEKPGRTSRRKTSRSNPTGSREKKILKEASIKKKLADFYS
jgi:hypothetical protein